MLFTSSEWPQPSQCPSYVSFLRGAFTPCSSSDSSCQHAALQGRHLPFGRAHKQSRASQLP